MSNFTPGPWAIIHETMVMSGNRSIASCGGYYSNMDSEKVRAENIANARLIAAAPLMYEALQDLIEVAKMEDWQYATTGRQMLLKNAQAALSAAGGNND